MKKLVLVVLMAVLGAISIEASAKTISSEINVEWYEQDATLKVVNNSDYYMTLKVMKEYGGLYTTLYIPSHSSSVASFSRSGRFYIKMKAEKGLVDASEFPLLLHIDEIITQGKPVDIPWEKFTFEK